MSFTKSLPQHISTEVALAGLCEESEIFELAPPPPLSLLVCENRPFPPNLSGALFNLKFSYLLFTLLSLRDLASMAAVAVVPYNVVRSLAHHLGYLMPREIVLRPRNFLSVQLFSYWFSTYFGNSVLGSLKFNQQFSHILLIFNSRGPFRSQEFMDYLPLDYLFGPMQVRCVSLYSHKDGVTSYFGNYEHLFLSSPHPSVSCLSNIA